MLCRSQKNEATGFHNDTRAEMQVSAVILPLGRVTMWPLWATVSMVAPTWCMYRNICLYIYTHMYKKEKKQTPVLISFC